MQKSTLLVDDDEGRRREIVQAFSRRGMRYLDVADAFGAMAALGRADFGAVVAAEGRRTLSLRGLCQLARRRHPHVAIFVLHRDETDPTQIPDILATAVECIPASTAPEEIARIVEDKLYGPVEITITNFEEPPSTSEALAVFDSEPTQKVHLPGVDEFPPPAPAREDITEKTQLPVRTQESPPPASAERHALLEGLLDGNAGPALLMGVYAAELTGRLVVKDGPAAGVLYFYRGEPVWADDPLGDQGLHRRLVQRGKLAPETQIEAVPQGQLLGSLVQNGLLTGQAMHDFMRDVVRDAVMILATAASGAYRFEEDKKFLDVAPLLKVNPFGLILESRRKSLSPAELLTTSSEMGMLYAIPAPGLQTAQAKLAAFVRGEQLDLIIDGSKTVQRIVDEAKLDPFMGTLVLIALRDARLISMESAPRAREGGVTLASSFAETSNDEITLVDAEAAPMPATSEDEAKAREEIFALYMKLKPLTVPRQVLGVGLDADLSEVEAAFQARLRELDPARIPEGSARQMMNARVEEIRKKVMHAYQAVRMQISTGTGVTHHIVPGSKTNPF